MGFCNPYRSGHDLLRRARCCAGTGYNSKRHSSFPRAFNSRHFDGHELHDVVQLAGVKLPNRLCHSRAAQDHAHWNNRDLKRDIEHRVRNGLYFEPASMSDELRPTILPNWKIKRAAVRFLWHTASFQLPCRPAASRRPGPPRRSTLTSSCATRTGRRSPTSMARMNRDTARAGKDRPKTVDLVLQIFLLSQML